MQVVEADVPVEAIGLLQLGQQNFALLLDRRRVQLAVPQHVRQNIHH